MGLFITLTLDTVKCRENCFKCVDVCPVDILDKDNTKAKVIEENEDECTLCDLCLNICPVDAIKIHKNY